MHKGGKKLTKVNTTLVSVEEVVAERSEATAGVLQWLKKGSVFV